MVRDHSDALSTSRVCLWGACACARGVCSALTCSLGKLLSPVALSQCISRHIFLTLARSAPAEESDCDCMCVAGLSVPAPGAAGAAGGRPAGPPRSAQAGAGAGHAAGQPAPPAAGRAEPAGHAAARTGLM